MALTTRRRPRNSILDLKELLVDLLGFQPGMTAESTVAPADF